MEPNDVFLAFMVDQGGNVVNACEALGVEVIKYNYHLVNSATLWSLGISGSAATCKNKAMGDLTKKLIACVGVFSHSAVNSDKLKEGHTETRGGPPTCLRPHQAKRHEVTCHLQSVIWNLEFGICCSSCNFLLACVAAVKILKVRNK